MLIANTADIHLGQVLFSAPGTRSRRDDMAASLDRFIRSAIDANAEVAIIAGDTFNSRRPDPDDLAVLSRGIDTAIKAGMTLIVTPGNHDGPDNVGTSSTQTLLFLATLDIPGLFVLTEPTARWLPTLRGNTLGVAAIPYPHKRAYDSVAPHLTGRERVEQMSTHLEGVITAMAEKLKSIPHGNDPLIFIGHLTVVGARAGSESVMQLGWDVAVRDTVLDQFDYAALGHIHRHQQINPKVWYPGSPEYIKFSEIDSKKGYLLADVQRGKQPVVRIIDSQARPMAILECQPDDAGRWVIEPSTDVKGAILHLNIKARADTDERSISALIRSMYADGASFVRREISYPERATTVTTGVTSSLTPLDAFAQFLTEKGYEREPYLSLARSVLQEAGVVSA